MEKRLKLLEKPVRLLLTRVYGKIGNDYITKRLLMKYQIPEYNSPDSEFISLAYDIVSDIFLKEHRHHANILNRKLNKYSTNIEASIKGYKICGKLKSDNSNGDLYFMYPNSDFIRSQKPRFARRFILKVHEKTRGQCLEFEAHMHKLFSKHDLAPVLLRDRHFISRNNTAFGILIMEKYNQNTVEQWLADVTLEKDVLHYVYTEIIRILDAMCLHNLTHGDLHWGNIGLVFDENDTRPIRFKLKLLDFGQSSVGKCDKKVELIQLLRTLNPVYHGKHPFKQSNAKYLEDKLYQYFVSLYPEEKLKKGMYEAHSSRIWHKYSATVQAPQTRKYMSTFRYTA